MSRSIEASIFAATSSIDERPSGRLSRTTGTAFETLAAQRAAGHCQSACITPDR